MSFNRTTIWLAAAVLAHLAMSVVHGSAHAGAHVPLSRSATVFVFAVIVAGPLAGLAAVPLSRRIGASVVAATMMASLAFGVINHFVRASADHVSSVDPEWRSLFTTTALLLAVTEVLGAWLALRLLREPTTVH
jgi:hypothetical protein